MKVTVQVGSVTVQTKGLDLTRRDVHHLLKAAASIAVALGEQSAEPEPDRTPLGFSAHIERLPETDLPAEPGDD